jgi:AcrR family transcriptional regulator
MSTVAKRPYRSKTRSLQAEDTRRRVLAAAMALFARSGIDRVTIAAIAARADVGTSTVYALYGSKEGLLHALMEQALFGERYEVARAMLDGVTDAVQLVALTADVAHAIYEGERAGLGLLRRASSFSPALRKLEAEFEQRRLALQEARVRALFEQRKQREDLSVDEARAILWMYTSRDVYEMLVHARGWSADRYRTWLARTLVEALVRPDQRPR